MVRCSASLISLFISKVERIALLDTCPRIVVTMEENKRCERVLVRPMGTEGEPELEFGDLVCIGVPWLEAPLAWLQTQGHSENIQEKHWRWQVPPEPIFWNGEGQRATSKPNLKQNSELTCFPL